MISRKLCPRTTSLTAADFLLKRQLQWLLLLRVLFLSVLLGISILLQSKEHGLTIPPLEYIAYFIAVIYSFTIISALLLRVITCYKGFAYVQLITDAFLTACLVFFSGGSQSIFITIYFFPIIVGGMLLFRQGGLLLASICTLSYGATLFAEYSGYNPRLGFQIWAKPLTDLGPAMHYFSIHGLSFFLVAILSALLSERLHKTEAALSQATASYDRLSSLYKQIFDDIGTGIITVDNNDIITSFNPASENITGFSAPEVTGQQINDFFPGLVPKNNNLIRSLTSLIRKDGSTVPVGYSWAKMRTQDGPGNCRIYTMQDLSQIKKMEDQVRQAEKMATIGEMAAGIAHEFRNPIAAVSGAAQLLYQDSQDQPANQKLMGIITRECDRLEQTIEDFLRFSKPAKPEKKWFSLSNVTKEAMQLLEQTPELKNNCAVTIDIPANLDCWADVHQIKQVLLNLISNAYSIIQNKNGEILITAREYEDTDGSEKTILEVTDNGPGIPDRIIGQIFDPFFTTRKNGTGLGLAIVKQIVESHDGDIQVKSKADHGTSFFVHLPLP